MDWLLATPQIQSAFSALGSTDGDTYVVSPNALAILEEISYKLNYEDQTLRTFRRAIGFGQNVGTDLIPLLENAKDQAVLDAVIRILVNLTVPVECLFSVDVMFRTEVGRHTIFELNKLLYSCKEAFTNAKSTKAIIDYMTQILESNSKLSLQQCDQINNCLLLLRNILHIPEKMANFIVPVNANTVHTVPMQNTILYNLFIQSIDKLVLYLMTCPQRSFWSVTMVQLIALMYKDQHVNTLQKLLNFWFDASLSESSEDNESNTSTPKQRSGDSSPMLTSHSTSDSSDSGSNSKAVCCEDRRQALREVTEATLHEVRRKGQEYKDFQDQQNSKMDKNTETNTTTENFERQSMSVDAEEEHKNYKSTEMKNDKDSKSDITIKDLNEINLLIPIYEPAQPFINKQSANNSTHTTKQKLSNNYKECENEFMPPPSLPAKASIAVSISPDSSPKSHQKVRHAGQLTLTKGKSLPQKRECPSSQSEQSDCGNGFRPPPTVPDKAPISAPISPDSLPNPHQKVRHAGQSNLPKGKSYPQKRECPSSQSEQSDCGNGFRPPPAVHDKAPISPDLLPKPHQKVRHTGQSNLPKGKSYPQKRECPSSKSEQSDCGYATQAENQESISTSSNDDDQPHEKPQHQKPPCNSKARAKQRVTLTIVDTKELRRKKLVRRSKSSLINMKGLVQHIPSDEDITNILKEFTVDFLLKAYDLLVEELHKKLLIKLKIPIDTSHFFWLVTYFLKFAGQLELDMEHINSVLTYDIVSYLTYEGVTLCEQVDFHSRQEGSDLRPYLRRLHLVVTAIREFLQVIETYKKVTNLSEGDREHLHRLELQICNTEDLRCLFVLLLRRFNPNLHTKQYLQDLIVTNHLLLLIMDNGTKTEDSVNFTMLNHISQFATADVMSYYGILLEDFNNNGQFVNDCIFTMMHHVGGDLGQISILFQPIILKTYSRIWKTEYGLCDDWTDLIEQVLHKFISTPQNNTLTLPTTSLTELTKEHNLENSVCTWTREEMDTLYWYYVQSKKDADAIGKIVNFFTSNGNNQKSRISIINQLLQQDIITLLEYDDLMKFEDIEYQRNLQTIPTSGTSESGTKQKSEDSTENPTDDIQILRNLIAKAYDEKHIIFLQKLLLECCYVKLMLKKFPHRENRQNLKYLMEAVAYHAIVKNTPIPVVQWSNDQALMMFYQPYVLLLQKLGFQLPAEAGSVFARIPDNWTIETMFNLAKKLGPLDKLSLKFDVKDLDERPTSSCKKPSTPVRLSCFQAKNPESNNRLAVGTFNSGTLSPISEIEMKHVKSNEIFAIPKAKHCNSIIRFTPDPSPLPPVPNWLQLVMRSKCKAAANNPTSSASSLLTMDQRIKTNASLLNISDPNNDPMALASASTLIDIAALPQNLTAVESGTKAETNILTATVDTAAAAKKINYQQEKKKQQQQQEPQVATTQTVTAPITKVAETISCSSIIGLNDEQLRKQGGNRNESFMSADVKMHSNESNGHKVLESSGVPTKTITETATTTTATTTTTSSSKKSSALESVSNTSGFQQQISNVSDDELMIESAERNDTASSGFVARINSLGSELNAMAAETYKNDAPTSDTDSVTSDLTRMYVSDEDDRLEIQIAHNF